MTLQPFSTDLSDAEWQILGPLLAPSTRRGRPRKHARRTMLDAVLYVCCMVACPRASDGKSGSHRRPETCARLSFFEAGERFGSTSGEIGPLEAAALPDS